MKTEENEALSKHTSQIDQILATLWLNVSNAVVSVTKNILGFRGQPETNASQIIVYRTGRLGDFLVSLPALKLVRETWPNAKIILVTTYSSDALQRKLATDASAAGGEKGYPWLELLPKGLVDEIVTLNLEGARAAMRHLRQRLAQKPSDAIIIMPFTGDGLKSVLRKIVFLRASGIKGPLIGCEIECDLILGRSRVHRLGLARHQVLSAAAGVLRWLESKDGKSAEHHLELTLPNQPYETIPQDIKKWLTNSAHTVALFPGGTFHHKRWPTDKFIELAKKILSEYPDTRFLLIGSKYDKDATDPLYSALGDGAALNATGKIDLKALVPTLKNCICLVSNDSGPAHLSSAIGCRTITVFSAIEFPGVWEPWNDRHRTVRKRLPCEGCGAATACPLGHSKCTTEIGVEDVLGKVRNAMSEAKNQTRIRWAGA